MTEPEAFDRLRTLDNTEKFSYAEKGRICLMVSQNLLHRERIDPETGESCSLSRWIHLAAPWGYATCFSAMRAVESLRDVPMEALSKIPASNFPLLMQLSTQVRNSPEVIKAAQTQRADKFSEHIKQHHPNQHFETTKTLRFLATESEAAEIEEAITMAMERGAMNRTEALLALAIDYKAAAMLEELSK